MEEIDITDKISYIKATSHPLSADIGIIKENGKLWLYDVGNNEEVLKQLTDCYNIAISHFHLDHVGNIKKIQMNQLYVSKETYRHTHVGMIVNQDIYIGNLHLFPLPSSHAKGCIGLEVDGKYTFVGDALYCKSKGGQAFYNVQLLKQEIEVLKKLKSKYLLVSHDEQYVRNKEDIIQELETIYQRRNPNDSNILVE